MTCSSCFRKPASALPIGPLQAGPFRAKITPVVAVAAWRRRAELMRAASPTRLQRTKERQVADARARCVSSPARDAIPAELTTRGPGVVVIVLGVTQIFALGSTYYLMGSFSRSPS